MAALSTLRGYVRDELGELTAGRWSDTQLNSWLNRGVDHCVGEFYRGKCWSLLRELTEYRTKTLAVSVTEYTMWDVITNVTASADSTNTWYGYIHGMLGNYPLHQASIREYHRLIATYGEYAPTTTEPWIVFNGYDRTTKYLAYTSGSTQPVKGSLVVGASGAAEARVAICPEPTSGTFTGEDASGNLYIYGDTGTFESESLTYQLPNSSSSELDIMTIAAAAVTQSHDNCPLFTVYPALTTADTLKVWYLNKPTAMSAATDTPNLPYDCDNLLIWWATAQAWQADRNFDMSDRLNQKFEMELQKKIADFKEVTFRSISG